MKKNRILALVVGLLLNLTVSQPVGAQGNACDIQIVDGSAYNQKYFGVTCTHEGLTGYYPFGFGNGVSTWIDLTGSDGSTDTWYDATDVPMTYTAAVTVSNEVFTKIVNVVPPSIQSSAELTVTVGSVKNHVDAEISWKSDVDHGHVLILGDVDVPFDGLAGKAIYPRDFAYNPEEETTYTITLKISTTNGFVTDQSVISIAPDPAPTDTPEPTDTSEPTNTPEPTDTPEPTNTPEPTDTPEPTNTPEGELLYTATWEETDCRQFTSSVMESGSACIVPEGVEVETRSDVHVSVDERVYGDEFVNDGPEVATKIIGKKVVLAMWGASFRILSNGTPTATITPSPTITNTGTPTTTVEPTEPATPTPSITPSPTSNPEETPVYTANGQEPNCRDYASGQLLGEGKACKVTDGDVLSTASDVHVSQDTQIFASELITGGTSITGTVYVYAQWGASFSVVEQPLPNAFYLPLVLVDSSAGGETPVDPVSEVPVFTATGTLPSCSDFNVNLLAAGQACVVPEGQRVSTSSDGYVSADTTFHRDELKVGGGNLSGRVYFYAPWGASFTVN